jgi:GTP-binding protein HflX
MSQNGRRRGEHRTTMLESPLSATWTPRVRERAVLVGVGPGIEETDLEELAALADSAGAEAVARIVQTRSDPDPATYVGKGKLHEIHDAVHRSRADVVILDRELSPGQLRNLEERLGTKVIDRTALILDIFALHAQSREGKAQVELAQLNYLLPRLRGWGEALSRAGGGIGTRFGGGETKLEVDRQHIRKRISKLRKDIKELARTRDVKRGRRERSGVPQVAIAGYTNAGKSTLMRALTQADVLVANQLFATLDPTTRRIELPNGRAATVSDTVGFVSKLPHDLVEAFRSTLEEVSRADLVLHVADASSRDVDEQVRAVRGVLGEIGAGGVVEVLALNKADLVRGDEVERVAARFPGAVPISALTGRGIGTLLERIEADLPRPPVELRALIPYDREDLVARLHRDADVLETERTDDGTIVHARVGDRDAAELAPFVLSSRPRRATAG